MREGVVDPAVDLGQCEKGPVELAQLPVDPSQSLLALCQPQTVQVSHKVSGKRRPHSDDCRAHGPLCQASVVSNSAIVSTN